ncbi:MAG: SBBP repeat-containing protein [candidate division WOR-3 bacterium]
MMILNLIITFNFSESSIKSYDLAIVQEFLSSNSYHYKGFTPNKGQVATTEGGEAKEVIFYSEERNLGIFLTSNGLSYVIYDLEKKEYSRIDYELINANIERENILYEDEMPGHQNFYLAHCPQGVLFVKSYRKVIIKEIYPGIDWLFRYDEEGKFHHEFLLRANAQISEIKIKVKYADMELADNGKSIILSTPIGKIKDGNLVAYEGNKKLEVNYQLNEDILSFDVKNYEGKYALLIDPHILLWGTYYGGIDDDIGFSIKLSKSGDIYIAGQTLSKDFPTKKATEGAYYNGKHSGSQDLFVLKFNRNLTIEWATYYGGSNSDFLQELDIHPSGDIFIVGSTGSINFPTYTSKNSSYYQKKYAGGWRDAYVVRFSKDGERLWATYLGGIDDEDASSISFDKNGNIFIIGSTSSEDFPTHNPGKDAYFQEYSGLGDIFIMKFSDEGKLIWGTYFGGSGIDGGGKIEVDKNGNLFISGFTSSEDFPTYSSKKESYYQENYGGEYDFCIMKFSNKGKLLWSTYYGGDGREWGGYLVLDKNDNVFITGLSSSSNFPVIKLNNEAYLQDKNAGEEDAIILKFDNNGKRIWATLYGGNNNDYGYSLKVAPNGNLFVVGSTFSDDLPLYKIIENDYFQKEKKGESDIFILEFDKTGKMLWATYYGGNGEEMYPFIDTDSKGNLYIIGQTNSDTIPTTNLIESPFYNPRKIGEKDIFILKFK